MTSLTSEQREGFTVTRVEPRRSKRRNGEWGFTILPHAAEIVRSYATPVTLRQLFYRLVSDGTLRNTEAEYGQLSSRSAEWRREGRFPELADAGRSIDRTHAFTGVADALDWLADLYRRDRTEGQAHAVYIAVEKAGLVAQLWAAFSKRGIPVLALRGYSSETFEREVAEDIVEDGRPAVILYAGDFDPSGEDLERNFREQLVRRGVTFDLVHVALTRKLIDVHALIENPGKETDSRAADFERRHGGLFQVEVDALPPEVLRALFQERLDTLHDPEAFAASIAREDEDRDTLLAVVDTSTMGPA